MSAKSNILSGLVDLLEGKTGAAGCSISAGLFRHTNQPVEELKTRSVGRPQPFNLRDPALQTGTAEHGDMTAATRMRGSSELELVIAYGSKPHDVLTLMGEMNDDETSLRAVVEYEPNIALTTGWTGCTVAGSEYRDVEGEGDNAPPKLRLLVLRLSVSHRDERIAS